MKRPARPLSYIVSCLLWGGIAAAVLGFGLAIAGFAFGPQLILAGMMYVVAGFSFVFLPCGLIDMERRRDRLSVFGRLITSIETLILGVFTRPIPPGLPPPRVFLVA